MVFLIKQATEKEKETERILFNERDKHKDVLVNHHMVYKLNKKGFPGAVSPASVHLNY